MTNPFQWQTPDTRLRYIKFAQDREKERSARIQEGEAVRLDSVRQDIEREQQRRNTLQEHEAVRFDDTAKAMERERQRKADREARQAYTPTPARTTREQLYMEGRRPLRPAERLVSPAPGPGLLGRGLDVLGGAAEDVLGPVGQFMRPPSELATEAYTAIPSLGQRRPSAAERGFAARTDVAVPPGPFESLIGPTALDAIERDFGPNVRREVEFLTSPTGALTTALFPVGAAGGAVTGVAAGEAARKLGASEGVQMALQGVGNLVGGGVAETFARTPSAGVRATRAVTEAVPEPRVPRGSQVDTGLDDFGRPRLADGETAFSQGDAGRATFEDPHVARADPGPPPPRKPATGGVTPDDLEPLRITGEMPEETLIRRHQGAIDTGALKAERDVETGNQLLRRAGWGRSFRGTVVEKTPGEFDELNRALHNPSRVASGEMTVPDELRPLYDNLRAETDFEQAARVDFDPGQALVEDYFFRGWKPPEGMFTSEVRGPLGRNPAFRMPRINATYDEMRAAGFEPLFANPVEQSRYSRLMGIKYREQMALIKDLKANELAFQVAGGPIPKGYRVPKVGSAFEGKPYATGDGGVMFTRQWAVQDSLANRLENVYGKSPKLGTGTIFGKTIDLQKAVDAAVFLPKRAKLIGSVFQHVDFLNRSHIGAWTGFVDAIRRGEPVAAAGHLARWPKSVYTMVRAVTGPGWRQNLRNMALDATPLFENRRLSMKMISEAGLSRRDPTLGIDIDDIAREIRQESKLTRTAKAPLRALGELERMWRDGLFKGMYPAAILTDVKNNIAPMMIRQHPKATDTQLAGMIAKAANADYSVIPESMSVVQNQVARSILKRMFFSFGEQEGLLRIFTGAIKGENAAYFRTRWLGAYLSLIGMANIIHFASTGEPLPSDRWTPINKDKWGPLPIGYNRDFAAPNIPLTGRSGVQVTADLVGQMDTAFRLLDPESFLKSRESVPVRAIENQRTGKDFFGAPIDTVGPGGVISRTAQLIQDMFAPIGPGQAGLETLRSNIEETEGLIQPGEDRLGTTGIGVQATGVNLRAETTPQLLDRIRGDVMREMGIEGRYEELDQITKPDVDAKVEERIGPELEMRRETSELRGQTTPAGEFYRDVDILRGEQEEAQLSADAKLNSNQWAGDVWREDFTDRQREGYIRRDERKQAAGIEFKDHPAKNKIDKAINDYFDVNIDKYLQDDGTTDWDGFFGAQDDALDPLSPADKKAVMEKVVHKYDTPTVKEFREAQEVVDKFYKTPKYVGLTVEQGQDVDKVLYDMAPALQTRFEAETGEKLSRREAVRHLSATIRDKKAREFLLEHFGGGVQAGLRRIGEGGGLRRITDVRRETDEIRNEKRDQILIDNERLLVRFYNDLLERELSREQEAGLLPTTLEALFGPSMALPDVERRGLRLITAR